MSGRGILDTLKAVTRLVIRDLRTKRIVPPARPAAMSAVPSLGGPMANLEDQIDQHLSQTPPPMELPKLQPVRSATATATARPARPAAPAPAPALSLGAVSALAPEVLLDAVRVAEASFASGDHGDCVRAAADGVRRALAFAGDGTLAQQGYLLRVDGQDLLKLETLVARSHHRVDDAAFALYVLSQALVRLGAAGLPDVES